MADEQVHLSVLLPESERDSFERFCKGSKPRISMVAAIRELMRLAIAGKVHIDRERARIPKGPPKTPPAKPAPKRPRK